MTPEQREASELGSQIQWIENELGTGCSDCKRRRYWAEYNEKIGRWEAMTGETWDRKVKLPERDRPAPFEEITEI